MISFSSLMWTNSVTKKWEFFAGEISTGLVFESYRRRFSRTGGFFHFRFLKSFTSSMSHTNSKPESKYFSIFQFSVLDPKVGSNSSLFKLKDLSQLHLCIHTLPFLYRIFQLCIPKSPLGFDTHSV